MDGKRILLIVGGGIAAYKSLELIRLLAKEGIATRVVSLPSPFMFEKEDASYRNSMMPRGIPRVAVEAGVSDWWRKYVGLDGAVIGIDRFGECGPQEEVYEFFGVTAEKVAAAVNSVLS